MDPYAIGLFNQNPFSSKRIIQSSVVAVLQVQSEERGLRLIQPRSRAFKKVEIHELILTDEQEVKPGQVVNKVAYLAFIEISHSGVIVVGDEVYWNNRLLGVVTGFDDTHMPNHQNILLYSEKRMTGKDVDIQIDDQIMFQAKEANK